MNDSKKGGGINPLVIGAVGAAVGAAAVVLSDEKNRQKVMDSLTKAGEQVKAEATGKIDELKSQADEVRGQVEEKAREMTGRAEEMKDKAEKAANTAKKASK